MELSGEILDLIFLGNPVRAYAWALGTFLGSVVVLYVLQSVLLRRLVEFAKRTETGIDDSIASVIDTIKPPFYWFIAFYIGTRLLVLEGLADKTLQIVLVAWIVYQVIMALQIFFEHFIRARFIREHDRTSEVIVGILTAASRIILWTLGILLVLQNVGVNVTALIAGLGIGGLALALAAQKILEDLFSSLAIYFDRPFAPGDFIKVGETKGTVQRVGIKTTRIKALSGEEVVIPNKEITDSWVQNYRKMKERRVAFTFGVTYGTSQEKMKQIPDIVKKTVEGRENVEYERTNFNEFGDSALMFEAVYTLTDRKYVVYTDTHQEILLAIKDVFEREGIEMAFPTQTIHLQKSEG